jgi:alginate O-acetyltransferase complex protein AlgJ
MLLPIVKKTANLLLIVLFLALIFAPPLKMLFTKENLRNQAEKRTLAPAPSMPRSLNELVSFSSSADDYLEDHFGYRDFYIYRYQRELDKRFNQAGLNSKVVTGLDGWYFFNEFGLLNDFQGKSILSPTQLDKWLSYQNEKQAWLEQRGIKFLLLAAPNKQSIYPHYLMKHAMAIKGKSRFEQLLEHTSQQLPSYMLNLHTLLQPEKYKKPLYYKNDTHWNKLAAYLVFQEAFKNISSWFPKESFRTEFEFVQDETGIGGNSGKGGDLTQILMKKNLTETFPQIKKFKRCESYIGFPYQLTNITNKDARYSFSRKCRKMNLKAVIFRDSFFVHLEPFFSENFREVVYLWKNYDQKNIEEIMTYFKPDVVIEETSERHLFDFLLERE